MNLRAARAEWGAVQPKAHVSFSESGRDCNVLWRGTLASAKPRQVPAARFLDFLGAGARAAGRFRNEETVNLAAAEVITDSCAASCCGKPFAATPGLAFSGASISTRRSSCHVLPHEFLKTRFP